MLYTRLYGAEHAIQYLGCLAPRPSNDAWSSVWERTTASRQSPPAHAQGTSWSGSSLTSALRQSRPCSATYLSSTPTPYVLVTGHRRTLQALTAHVLRHLSRRTVSPRPVAALYVGQSCRRRHSARFPGMPWRQRPLLRPSIRPRIPGSPMLPRRHACSATVRIASQKLCRVRVSAYSWSSLRPFRWPFLVLLPVFLWSLAVWPTLW